MLSYFLLYSFNCREDKADLFVDLEDELEENEENSKDQFLNQVQVFEEDDDDDEVEKIYRSMGLSHEQKKKR